VIKSFCLYLKSIESVFTRSQLSSRLPFQVIIGFPVANCLPSLFLFADPPLVTLRLGSTLTPDDIKEGDDVYFECHVQSNPQWRKLLWLHNVGRSVFKLARSEPGSHTDPGTHPFGSGSIHSHRVASLKGVCLAGSLHSVLVKCQ